MGIAPASVIIIIERKKMATIKAQAQAQVQAVPGAGLDFSKMPGHWVLAQMGKRVLRPGGLEITHRMLECLQITRQDDVVEFAPGLGVTARKVLAKSPATYTGLERDETAAAMVQGYLKGATQRCIIGRGEDTGLPGESASVPFGEALLTMQTPSSKQRIVAEAFRVLRPGGRYAIHEIALTPDALSDATKAEIAADLQASIRVGARPLTQREWREMLQEAGFEIHTSLLAPMALLEPKRMLQDEGVRGLARIAANLLRNPAARARVLNMRQTFRKHARHMSAIALVAVKPAE